MHTLLEEGQMVEIFDIYSQNNSNCLKAKNKSQEKGNLVCKKIMATHYLNFSNVLRLSARLHCAQKTAIMGPYSLWGPITISCVMTYQIICRCGYTLGYETLTGHKKLNATSKIFQHCCVGGCELSVVDVWCRT